MKIGIKYLIIPFGIFSFIGVATIIDFIIVVQEYSKVFTHEKEFQKKIIKVDSLQMTDLGDNDNSTMYGLSKELNNYKTTIKFGSYISGKTDKSWFERSKVENDSTQIGDYNETQFHYLWVKDDFKSAFPALAIEKYFPVKQRIFEELYLFILWIISIVMTFIIYKIGNKMTKTNENN